MKELSIRLLLLFLPWLVWRCDSPPSAPLLPPQAEAGEDLQVRPGEPAILDASGSSSANDSPLKFAWIQISGPVVLAIEGADSVQARVVPEVPGVYAFRVTVTDNRGLSASDEVSLIVMPGKTGGTLRIASGPVSPKIARIVYAIVATDMDTLKGELVITEDRIGRKTVLKVPSGKNRLVELYGYDSNGRMMAYGSILISIEEGEISEVEIEMKGLLPRSGEIVVEAIFEEEGE